MRAAEQEQEATAPTRPTPLSTLEGLPPEVVEHIQQAGAYIALLEGGLRQVWRHRESWVPDGWQDEDKALRAFLEDWFAKGGNR